MADLTVGPEPASLGGGAPAPSPSFAALTTHALASASPVSALLAPPLAAASTTPPPDWWRGRWVADEIAAAAR